MIGNARALWTVLAISSLWGLAPPAAEAQPAQAAVELVSPAALRFEAPSAAGEPADRYVVEIFRYEDGRDLERSVMRFERDRSPIDSGPLVRLDIADDLHGLPAGMYIASVRPVGGKSTWNGRTMPFVAGTEPEVAAAERFWTRVAIAIGVGILMIPFLAR